MPGTPIFSGCRFGWAAAVCGYGCLCRSMESHDQRWEGTRTGNSCLGRLLHGDPFVARYRPTASITARSTHPFLLSILIFSRFSFTALCILSHRESLVGRYRGTKQFLVQQWWRHWTTLPRVVVADIVVGLNDRLLSQGSHRCLESCRGNPGKTGHWSCLAKDRGQNWWCWVKVPGTLVGVCIIFPGSPMPSGSEPQTGALMRAEFMAIVVGVLASVAGRGIATREAG